MHLCFSSSSTPHASTLVFVLCIWTPLKSKWDNHTENHSNLENSSDIFLVEESSFVEFKNKTIYDALKSAPRIKLRAVQLIEIQFRFGSPTIMKIP